MVRYVFFEIPLNLGIRGLNPRKEVMEMAYARVTVPRHRWVIPFTCHASLGSYKVGPYTSYKWSYGAPISRVITPVIELFLAIYRGPITLLITIGLGPTL